jgi:hypothetical protein
MVYRIQFLNWVTNYSAFPFSNFKFLFCKFGNNTIPLYWLQIQYKPPSQDFSIWLICQLLYWVCVGLVSCIATDNKKPCMWVGKRQYSSKLRCSFLDKNSCQICTRGKATIQIITKLCSLFPAPQNEWKLLASIINWVIDFSLCLNSLVIPMYFWLNLWICCGRC